MSKIFLIKNSISFIAIYFFLGQLYAQNSDKTLWYKQPAKVFEESLVLGNGTLGASVFGGTASEKIYRYRRLGRN